MSRDGRAVLVIAHSSEKSGGARQVKVADGSSVIRARARWTCFIESHYGNTRLTFSGNYGAPHQITRYAARWDGGIFRDICDRPGGVLLPEG